MLTDLEIHKLCTAMVSMGVVANAYPAPRGFSRCIKVRDHGQGKSDETWDIDMSLAMMHLAITRERQRLRGMEKIYNSLSSAYRGMEKS